jgi:hypothetical protein
VSRSYETGSALQQFSYVHPLLRLGILENFLCRRSALLGKKLCRFSVPLIFLLRIVAECSTNSQGKLLAAAHEGGSTALSERKLAKYLQPLGQGKAVPVRLSLTLPKLTGGRHKCECDPEPPREMGCNARTQDSKHTHKHSPNFVGKSPSGEETRRRHINISIPCIVYEYYQGRTSN